MMKNLMRHAGIKDPDEAVRRFNAGEFTLAPRVPQALLVSVGDPVVLAAVSEFVAKDAFTKTNGIAWMGDNFEQYILPVVEKNVPEAVIQVFELTRDAKNLAISAELKVHERGRLSLAHFFRAVIRDRISSINTGIRWSAAFVIGSNVETWSVNARLDSDGWHVDAFSLGFSIRWGTGARFLSC